MRRGVIFSCLFSMAQPQWSAREFFDHHFEVKNEVMKHLRNTTLPLLPVAIELGRLYPHVYGAECLFRARACKLERLGELPSAMMRLPGAVMLQHFEEALYNNGHRLAAQAIRCCPDSGLPRPVREVVNDLLSKPAAPSPNAARCGARDFLLEHLNIRDEVYCHLRDATTPGPLPVSIELAQSYPRIHSLMDARLQVGIREVARCDDFNSLMSYLIAMPITLDDYEQALHRSGNTLAARAIRQCPAAGMARRAIDDLLDDSRPSPAAAAAAAHPEWTRDATVDCVATALDRLRFHAANDDDGDYEISQIDVAEQYRIEQQLSRPVPPPPPMAASPRVKYTAPKAGAVRCDSKSPWREFGHRYHEGKEEVVIDDVDNDEAELMLDALRSYRRRRIVQWTDDDAMPFSKSIEKAEEEEKLCLVCDAKPRQYGFVHDKQVCTMVCDDCQSKDFGKTCPWCRKPYLLLVRVHGK